MTESMLRPVMGSPPHTRGKDPPRRSATSYVGITPAYAGKSDKSFFASFSSGDHPRIRGEKRLTSAAISPWRGSPPHTRGKDVNGGIDTLYIRITPAYAGKRSTQQRCGQFVKDHPRIRGEKRCTVMLQPFRWGSPPHTRGKADVAESLRSATRITPAYAGKSVLGVRLLQSNKDHPRIRGEKWVKRSSIHS